MKTLTLFCALSLVGSFSCSKGEININDFDDNSSITSLNGTWKVVSFEDITSQTVEVKTEENSLGHDIIVTFDDTVDPNEVSGQNTTNSIFGEFEYVGDRQFEVNGLASTYVAQPEWGNMFVAAMTDGTLTYKINAHQLRIYYDDETKSVTLSKE